MFNTCQSLVLSFFFWLTLLNMLFSSSIQKTAQLSFIVTELYTIVCICYHICIHSFVVKYLDYFHILTIVLSATINVGVHITLLFMFCGHIWWYSGGNFWLWAQESILVGLQHHIGGGQWSNPGRFFVSKHSIVCTITLAPHSNFLNECFILLGKLMIGTAIRVIEKSILTFWEKFPYYFT